MGYKLLLNEERLNNSYRCQQKKYLIEIAKKRNIIPLKESPNLAKLCGHLFGDGGIKGSISQVRFYGKKEKLLSLKKEYEKLFNKRINSIKKNRIKGKNYRLDIVDSITARCFSLIGIPSGEKVIKKFLIPEWIMKGNKEVKRNFLQALFDDELEGLIKNKNKFNTWNGLKFKMSKSKENIKNMLDFLNQIRLLLDEFEIETTKPKAYLNQFYKRKDKKITYACYFRISCKIENRKKFYNEIGFIYDKNKQKALYNSILKNR